VLLHLYHVNLISDDDDDDTLRRQSRSNNAWCRATLLIESNTLTTKPSRHHDYVLPIRVIGRPHSSWMATLKNHLSLHNLTFEDAIEMALDKPLWGPLAASRATHWWCMPNNDDDDESATTSNCIWLRVYIGSEGEVLWSYLYSDRSGCCGASIGPAGRQRNDLSVAWKTTEFIHCQHGFTQELAH